jgi:hypothetical protein
MNLANVMDEVADKLRPITGLQVFAYPEKMITPPTAIITYPDDYTFDETYGRGSDRITLPVHLIVADVTAESSKYQIAEYCDGSGARSVKAIVEAGTYTSCDSVRVSNIDFGTMKVAGLDYISAVFDLDVFGPGSA